MSTVGVICPRYFIRVYLSLGVIDFVLLSQCVSVCGCMSTCLGLGLELEFGYGRDVLVFFLALSVQS